jgi:hypothetical protein
VTANSSSYKNFPIGVALAVAGYVAIKKGMESLSRQLSEGDLVHSDERIETGDDGEVVIGLADGSSIDLPANIEVVLDAEVFDPGEVREMHSHNAALDAMQQSILGGNNVQAALQAAQQSYSSQTDAGIDAVGDAPSSPVDSSELGSKQTVSGDQEIHTLPEMMLPRISISNIRILEPAPGNKDDGHDSGHDDTSHDSGHDSVTTIPRTTPVTTTVPMIRVMIQVTTIPRTTPVTTTVPMIRVMIQVTTIPRTTPVTTIALTIQVMILGQIAATVPARGAVMATLAAACRR